MATSRLCKVTEELDAGVEALCRCSEEVKRLQPVGMHRNQALHEAIIKMSDQVRYMWKIAGDVHTAVVDEVDTIGKIKRELEVAERPRGTVGHNLGGPHTVDGEPAAEAAPVQPTKRARTQDVCNTCGQGDCLDPESDDESKEM